MRNKKVEGGIIAIIGFLLSPLSWWNDLFINIPLAYIFAFPFGLLSEDYFFPMMILGYWITNIIGFMMIHFGVESSITDEKKSYTKKMFIKDFIISVAYTIIVVIFVGVGWIKFPMEYFE